MVIGFAIAFALALLAHRHRWLQPPLLAATGILFTIPSIAFFLLLLPITGLGRETAIIALSAYTLQIIYRNTMLGLANVPDSVKEAARGMGLTERQILWKVELPLAIPEIIAGLRIATVSTVAIATLAVFAGGGGLGTQIYGSANLNFPTAIIIAGAIVIAMAFAFDAMLLRCSGCDAVAAGGGEAMSALAALPDSAFAFTGAFEFIFTEQESSVTGGKKVGGIEQVARTRLDPDSSVAAGAALALVIALPIGLYFGHRGTGELLAVGDRQRRPGDPRAGADRPGRRGDRGRDEERGARHVPHPDPDQGGDQGDHGQLAVGPAGVADPTAKSSPCRRGRGRGRGAGVIKAMASASMVTSMWPISSSSTCRIHRPSSLP